MKNEMFDRQRLKRKAQTLSDSEVAEVLEYINIMESLRYQSARPDPLDEAILKLLSEATRDFATKSRLQQDDRNRIDH